MRLALKFYTQIILTASYAVVLFTFLSAYMRQDKIIEISVNSFGEAFAELCILVPALPLVFLRFKEFLDEEKMRALPLEAEG